MNRFITRNTDIRRNRYWNPFRNRSVTSIAKLTSLPPSSTKTAKATLPANR